MRIVLLAFIFFVSGGSFAQNVWDSIADFGAGQRQRAISFSLNGKGYVGTGLDTADIVHNDMWQYDPVADVWSQVASIPGAARRNAVAFTIGYKAFVGTGVDNASAPAGTILNDFYEYDFVLNSWIQIANYPMALYFASGISAGGKGYVCGGKLGPDYYTNDLYEYKPSTNAWAQRADFPGGVRYQMVSMSVDGFAYIGLGADEDIYRKDWWKFNPGSNQWTQMDNFYGNERAAAVTFNLNGRGHIAMGTDGGYRDDVWEYNHNTDTWVSKENFPGKGRRFASAFTIGDTAYVGIGKAFDGGKRSFNKYYPSAASNTSKKLSAEVTIIPNPIIKKFNIVGDQVEVVSIQLYDVNLSLLETHVNDGSNTYELNQTHPKGVYLLLMKDGSENVLSIKKITIE